MKIMCKAGTPIMLSHFFRKISWTLESMWEMERKWLDEYGEYKLRPSRRAGWD